MTDDDLSDGRVRRDFVLPALLLTALLLRIAVIVVRHEQLQVDTDAYLAIAQNLLNGNGYCSVPGQPTAFRPPLYPLLVAACLSVGGPILIGAVQTLFGAVTVWLTYRLARCCQFSHRTGLLAAGLVAVDPLLIMYTAEVMTETLFTFLVTSLLAVSLWRAQRAWKGVVVGVLFGITALCRPSIWAFGALAVVGWLASVVLDGRSAAGGEGSIIRHDRWYRLKTGAACAVSVAVTVSPWVLRNALQFDSPILMTTHGGYTLRLGNNSTFYREVVQGRSGTVWDGASLRAWQAEQEQLLAGMGISSDDEIARDAAFRRLAQEWMVANPVAFLRSSVLRVQRFWACRPSVSSGIPSVIVIAVSTWYLSVFVAAVVGAVRWHGTWRMNWTLPALVLALSLVHSVYWSNARMRSAAIPVISLASAAAFQRSTRQGQ